MSMLDTLKFTGEPGKCGGGTGRKSDHPAPPPQHIPEGSHYSITTRLLVPPNKTGTRSKYEDS